jgi:hypothetical protein
MPIRREMRSASGVGWRVKANAAHKSNAAIDPNVPGPGLR